MNLQLIKNFCERRQGGLRQLAEEIGMSEANLHRCIRNNKIQASDLEKIALLLKVDIRTFFDDSLSDLANHKVETNGDFSPASMHGDVSVGTDAVLAERVKLLQQLIKEKDERINELKERIEELKAK